MTNERYPAVAPRRSAFSVLICIGAMLSVVTADSAAFGQLRRPGMGMSPARPASPLSRRSLTGSTSSVMSARSPLGRPSGGLTSSDLSGFVYRPRLLLQGSGFAAPIRRMTIGGMVNNLRFSPSQAEMEAKIEAAIEAMKNSDPPEDRYAEMLFTRIRSERRHLLGNGWGYFKEGENLRARMAFQAAELVDPRAPAPRFGQIIVDVRQKHYRRAMTQLAKLVTYDQTRSAGMPGMFEYTLSLQKLYGSEDDLRTMLFDMGRFAQNNPTSEPVQALYCLILWYSGYDDARIEAVGIASRLKRTAVDPNSAWARFHDLVQAAQRKRELAGARS